MRERPKTIRNGHVAVPRVAEMLATIPSVLQQAELAMEDLGHGSVYSV